MSTAERPSGSLSLIGLGLGSEKDVTIAGLEAIKAAELVFLEAYTSVLGVKVSVLEEFYGKKIHVADRYRVESGIDVILERAKDCRVALLVVGDPYCATTHTDLVLRAKSIGVEVKVYHNASIMSAAGCCGLHLYNFGRTISIPFNMEGATDETKPMSYYDYLAFNDSGNLHTLALLDIKVKEPNVEAARMGKVVYDPPRFMTVNQALMQLIDCERIQGKGVIKPDETLCVGLARVGRDDQLIVAGTINEVLNVDFGAPLHSMVICSSELHELEKAMLEQYSPEKALADLERRRRATPGINASVDSDGKFSQAEWAMDSTVSSIAVQAAEQLQDDEISAEDDAEIKRLNELAKHAALATDDVDASEIASECSDMSDVSDIFPSVGMVVDDEDDED